MSDFRLSRRSSDFTYAEARVFKHQIIDTWTPETELWAMKHGDGILGVLCGMGGILVTHLFRRQMKLLPYARMTCYLPVVGLSSITCLVAQEAFVTTELLISNKCPLCLTTRASMIQLGLGLGYTLFSAPAICFYMSERLLTYPLPPLTRAPREVLSLVKKLIMKNRRTYFALGAFQMIAASFITYQKQNNMIQLDKKFSARTK